MTKSTKRQEVWGVDAYGNNVIVDYVYGDRSNRELRSIADNMSSLQEKGALQFEKAPDNDVTN